MKKWAIALLALLIASPLCAEEKYNTNGVAGALPITIIPGQIIISTDLGAEWFTLGGGNGNCHLQINGPGSASLICPNFGSGTGATLPPGGPPQFIGYRTTDQVEAVTSVGDVTFARTAANTYTATVVSISSVLPSLQVTGPVAINGPLSVTGQTTLNNVTGAAANFTTVTATSSITTANASISGVLNFGANGNLYFNGRPMGGTCPDGQFVNFIDAKGVPTCAEPPSGGAVTFVGPNPPPNPVEGLLWFNTLDLQTYIWYNDGTSSQWVAIVNIVAGGGAPTNNPAFTGTATFQNITVSGNSIFNGPSTFNNTVTFPDGSTWTSNMLYINENTTVNMPNLTNFPGGWTPWNWASPADNVPAFWDDTGIEQLYDVTTQYVTLPVPTPGSPSSANAPDNLEVIVQTNPDDAAHNYPWGQYTLQNYGAPPQPDAGNTQTWQAEGLEFINSVGIHGDTWSQGCTVVDVNHAYLGDCAIAARASSLYNNINYKILVTNQSSGTLARASYALQTTNSWAAMSLSGSGFTPANGQQADQLDINTNASKGINFTVGSGSTTPVSVAQITTGGMNINGTVTINGNPVTGGGPWLPVNNPTFTGTLTGPNQLNTGGIDSLVWDYGDGLQATLGLGYGNTTESSFLIGQGMRYNGSYPNAWTRGGSATYGPTDVSSIQMAGAATVITGDTGLTVNQNFTPTMLFSISPKAYTLIPPMGNAGIPMGATFNLPVNITQNGSGTGSSSRINFLAAQPAATPIWGEVSVGQGNFLLASQAYADSTNGQWIATGNTAILENLSTQSGNVAFYQDTGLTVGSVYTPTVTAALVFPGNSASGWQINNYNAGNNAAAMYQASNGAAVAQLEVTGQGWTANPAFGPNTTILAGTVGPIDIVPYANLGVRFWGGVFIANITSQGDGFQGLQLGGYAARFNGNNGNTSLSVGNVYMSGTAFAVGGISGASFYNGSQWISDGGGGGGSALFQLEGQCVSMYHVGSLGGGAAISWTQIYSNCGSGEEITHINNLVSAKIPTITSGVLTAGSRDSFGWVTNVDGGKTTITFAEAFLGNSVCTLTPSSAPMIWFNAEQSAEADTFVCYDPTTGKPCSDGQTVEYHCFGQGEQQSELEARERRARIIK